MRSKNAAAFLILFGLCTPEAMADPTMECGIGKSSQVEIGNCLSDAEKTVDAAMSQALEFAGSAATELDHVTERQVAAPALKASQDAWSAYRDAHCDYVGTTFGGGSGTGIAISSCRIELARTRTEILMKFAQ